MGLKTPRMFCRRAACRKPSGYISGLCRCLCSVVRHRAGTPKEPNHSYWCKILLIVPARDFPVYAPDPHAVSWRPCETFAFVPNGDRL